MNIHLGAKAREAEEKLDFSFQLLIFATEEAVGISRGRCSHRARGNSAPCCSPAATLGTIPHTSTFTSTACLRRFIWSSSLARSF